MQLKEKTREKKETYRKPAYDKDIDDIYQLVFDLK